MTLQWLDGEAEADCPVCQKRVCGRRVCEFGLTGGAGYLAVRCPRCDTLIIQGDFVDNGDLADSDIDAYIESGAGIDAIAARLPRSPAIRTMLDVGCSYGFAMALGRRLYGWTCVGVDPSPSGVRGREELGLDIRTEALTDTTDLPGCFDFVFASEVLEHVPDPRRLLRILRGQLAPEGLLIITTPAAQDVDPRTNPEEVVTLLSPGLHLNLFTSDALEAMVREAELQNVAVTRDDHTWIVVATRDERADLPHGPGSQIPAAQLEDFYRMAIATAPPGGALDAGMSARLLRLLVNQGRYAQAEEFVPHVHELARERWALDLARPADCVDRLRAGQEFTVSLAGCAHALGFLALLGEHDPGRACDYFAVVDEVGLQLRAGNRHEDSDLRDLRASAIGHRVLAAAQAGTRGDAMNQVLERLEQATADGLITQEHAERERLRAFVEAATRGFAVDDRLVQTARRLAPGLSAHAGQADRELGLDALFCLATGPVEGPEAVFWATVARSAIARARVTFGATDHMTRIDAVLAEQLQRFDGQPPGPGFPLNAVEERPPSISVTHTAPPGSLVHGNACAHGLDTYWVDEAGTYLGGWCHAGGERVRRIELRRGTRVVGQDPDERTDLLDIWPDLPDIVWAGFGLYVPGPPTAALEIRAHTDTRTITIRPALPDHPLPDYSAPIQEPEYFGELTDLQEVAPPGPVLAIGLRSVDGEQRRTLESELDGRELVVVDVHPGPDVDVVADVHRLAEYFPHGHFAIVVSGSVLEHLAAPWLAAAQIRLVLKDGGYVRHNAPFAWPEHSQPNDFWRFTPAGLAELFGPRTGFEVIRVGRTGEVRLLPAREWREGHETMPTLLTAATSWIDSRAVAGWDPDAVRWPYEGATDGARAAEYPVEGLMTPSVQYPESRGMRVSAVLPVFNGRRYLPTAVQSVLDQTRLPDELIVVDDGSTDGGTEILDDFDFPFPVTVIRQINQGQSAARNAGIDAASGDVIALLDQDDEWRLRHIELLLAPLIDDPELAWCYSDFEEVDAEGRTLTAAYLSVRGVAHPKESLVDCLASDLLVLPSASLIRKAAILDVGGFDRRLSGYEDDDLFVRMFVAGWRHRFIPETTLRYRVHALGASAGERYLASRMIYMHKLLELFPSDVHFNRDFGQDVVLPRMRAATMNDYSQALALRQYDRARTLHAALVEISALQGFDSPRERLGLRMMSRPETMRPALLRLERLPARLRPLHSGYLSLGNRTAVRQERRK